MTRTALQNIAVVLAAHGDRGGDAPNSTLLAHRTALEAMGVFRRVTAGVLKGDLDLAAALAEAEAASPDRIVVYPMFMADGYFTNKVLPERIAAAGLAAPWQITAPLGLDPRLPALALFEALSTAARAQLDAAKCRLLLVGHGSELGPASANATRRAAEAIASHGRFATIETAFLEEAPFIDASLVAGTRTTIVSGFFSGDGLHAAEDVPNAITASGQPAIYAGPIGRSVELPRLIRQTIEGALTGG